MPEKMMQVRILDGRVPARVGVVGQVVPLPERRARQWARRGIVEFAPEEPKPAPAVKPEPRARKAPETPRPSAPEEPELDELFGYTVAQLRAMLPEDAEVEGSGSIGNVVKADLVRALRSGRYRRRDLRAEE